MKIDPNNPKLTAFALGELDERERAEIEVQIEQSAELRQAVDEIRSTAELLTKELRAEPVVTLSPDQRHTIDAKAASLNGRASRTPTVRPSLVRVLRLPLAAAAALLLVVVAWQFLLPSISPATSLVKGPVVAMHAPELEANPAPRRAPSYLHESPPPPVNTAAVNYDAVGQSYADSGSSDTVNAVFAGVTGPVPGMMPNADGRESDTQAYWTLVRSGDVSVRRYICPSTNDDLGALGYVLAEVEPRDRPGFSRESYDHVEENPFLAVTENPLSTFSIDVDTASYANVRRFLNNGQLPPPGAVRVEEMVNYFDYDYPLPTGDDPFSVVVDVADCPWNSEHLLARIGIKGQEFPPDERPPANLVFLLDVSSSMSSQNKLPLVKKSIRLLVDELSYDDDVAMVVYAGASGLALDSTSCDDKRTILSALGNLQAGGSTNGGAGIELAYKTAIDNFIEDGINRVILATDGDFNVGTTDRSSLTRLIEDKAKSGVFLSVLGFGMGNLNDATLETLADKGNGNYAYIDTLNEARKVLVEEIGGTLMTIAKDVKIQIEFNPLEVSAYRLIGYENRLLAAQDFNDDTKDAGEIGAGHTVTAFYEIVPGGVEVNLPSVDPLKYQQSPADAVPDDEGPRGLKPAARNGELMTVKLRYKQPDGDTSKLIEVPVRDEGLALSDLPEDFVFAASVASFGMWLRGAGTIPVPASADPEAVAPAFTIDAIREMAAASIGNDPFGYREEFVDLVARAASLAPSQHP
ncbi:MAG: von Willebrand factor type A domain-containing protein [Phycisphaerae bacterium]|jgi:Ca-activated chloride channel family protein